MYLDIYLFYVYVAVGLPAVLASVAVDASDQAHLVLEAGAVVDLLLDAATEETLQTSHNTLVRQTTEARFTKYLTIYRKIIVSLSYKIDLR